MRDPAHAGGVASSDMVIEAFPLHALVRENLRTGAEKEALVDYFQHVFDGDSAHKGTEVAVAVVFYPSRYLKTRERLF